MDQLVTVCTATLGDSWEHLLCSMEELRRFTRMPFVQIVSDDGTLFSSAKEAQRKVVDDFDDAMWTENPGPTYGIGHNLNHLFSLVKTPWAFVIEDGVRPGKGWLETALSAIEEIGPMRRGLKVGGIGLVSSFDHWELEVAGLLPGRLGLHAYFGKCSHETIRTFWNQEWNDGLICWPRLLPAITEACRWLEAETWPKIIQDTWRQPILDHDPLFHDPTGSIGRNFGETDWPKSRRAWPSLGLGSWALINMDAWRDVGDWREGCCFYEGHLSIRFAQQGYLSINIDNPPWLHYPSLAFHAVNAGMGKNPRHLEVDLGPSGIFTKDFGCASHEEMTALARSCYDPKIMRQIRDDLEHVEIYADPAWRPWC